jgi:hypothetical protein
MTNTQAIIIAVGIILAGVAIGVAQQTNPDSVTGCVFFTTPPTLMNGQRGVLTCDNTGKLRVNTT